MAVEKIILDIRAQTAKARKDINNLKTTTKGLNKEVNQTEKLMKKAATSMAAFASIGLITKAIGDMVRLNMEFEKTLTNVLTLLDKTSKAKFGDFLEAGALRTMSQFGLQVGDVNKALFDTISAGVKAGDSIKFLHEASKLAVGGVTSLSIAVDGMTSIMNAYALSIEDANKVASAFFTAQKHGKTTVAELAQNVGMLAPTMKMAGVGFQEMLSAMALLTKQGISTDMTTTALRATIIALTKTTPETEKVFKKLGIQTGISAIKANGLGETLLQIAKALEEDEDLLTIIIPSVRALTAVAALGEEALIDYNKILEDVTTNYGEGSDAAAAYELQMNTLRKRIDETKGSWSELLLTVTGEAEGKGGLKAIFGGLSIIFRGLTDALAEVPEVAPKAINAAGGIDAAFAEMAKTAKEVAEAQKILNDELDKALIESQRKKQWWELDESELDERQKKLKKQWDAEGKDKIESLTDIQLEIAEITMQLAESTTDYEKLAAEAKLDYLRQIAQEEIEIQKTKTRAILSIIGDAAFAASAFAVQGSTLQKILAIADTTISTYAAAQKAYESQSLIPVVGPFLAAAAMATAIASGLANVAAITGVGIPEAPSFGEGGFTGKSKYQLRDKDGPIAGYVHEDEFVFNRDKTRTLRPLFEDIHNNRIDIHGLAALTRRGTMKTMPKLNADLLERQVEKIYRKMSEERPEKSIIIQGVKGYTKTIGNTTINVST